MEGLLQSNLRFASSPASPGHSGWNMVALFAAARNSPCSCPFSVSLFPAQRALNSEPQQGGFWNISEFYLKFRFLYSTIELVECRTPRGAIVSIGVGGRQGA